MSLWDLMICANCGCARHSHFNGSGRCRHHSDSCLWFREMDRETERRLAAEKQANQQAEGAK